MWLAQPELSSLQPLDSGHARPRHRQGPAATGGGPALGSASAVFSCHLGEALGFTCRTWTDIKGSEGILRSGSDRLATEQLCFTAGSGIWVGVHPARRWPQSPPLPRGPDTADSPKGADGSFHVSALRAEVAVPFLTPAPSPPGAQPPETSGMNRLALMPGRRGAAVTQRPRPPGRGLGALRGRAASRAAC